MADRDHAPSGDMEKKIRTQCKCVTKQNAT